MKPTQEKPPQSTSQDPDSPSRGAPRKMSESKFLELYNEHSAMLLRVVARAGVLPSNVEDVCQDVWREVFEKKETHFKGTDQDFRSWLCQIGRNRATDWLRKRDNRTPHLEPEWERADPAQESALALQIHREKHAVLQTCMEMLKEPRGTIVRERLSGTAVVEIADKVQLTRDQVDRQFHAAKEQLKACVQEKLKDETEKGAL